MVWCNKTLNHSTKECWYIYNNSLFDLKRDAIKSSQTVLRLPLLETTVPSFQDTISQI